MNTFHAAADVGGAFTDDEAVKGNKGFGFGAGSVEKGRCEDVHTLYIADLFGRETRAWSGAVVDGSGGVEICVGAGVSGRCAAERCRCCCCSWRCVAGVACWCGQVLLLGLSVSLSLVKLRVGRWRTHVTNLRPGLGKRRRRHPAIDTGLIGVGKLPCDCVEDARETIFGHSTTEERIGGHCAEGIVADLGVGRGRTLADEVKIDVCADGGSVEEDEPDVDPKFGLEMNTIRMNDTAFRRRLKIRPSKVLPCRQGWRECRR